MKGIRTGNIKKAAISLLVVVIIGLGPYASASETAFRHIESGMPIVQNGDNREIQFAGKDQIAALNSAAPDEYLLGPGDEFELKVWGRPEFSGIRIIGPDGRVMFPLIGELILEGLSRNKAAGLIRDNLAAYYDPLFVDFEIKTYRNNKAFVLGRVGNPGIVNFYGRGTLLEALASAGGLPVLDRDAFLARCAIIRGNNQIIWIDLDELLDKGNIALNLRILNNDVIFIPDSEDSMVYVMGEVANPGAYRIQSELTLMDALMLAGGPTEDGKTGAVRLIRGKNKDEIYNVDIKAMLEKGDMSGNRILEDDDIIYVPPRGIKKKSYLHRKLGPFIDTIMFGVSILK